MSAPLTPAARTRTSSSFSPGSGSGRSSTTRAPSWIVTARTGGNCTRTNEFVPDVGYGAEAANERTSADSRQCPAAALARGQDRPGGRGAPARSDLPRRWRRRRARPPGAADPGLSRGRRLAGGDGPLAAGLRLPAEEGRDDRERGLLERGACPARAQARAPRRRAGAPYRDRGPKPRRRPDLVCGIVTLGSPELDPLAVHPLVRLQLEAVGRLGSLGAPRLFKRSCLDGDCCAAFWEDLAAPLPRGVGFVSVYSRS